MKNTNIRDLTIDQLGIVSGGNEIETQEDSENLFKLGLLDEAYGDDDLAFDWNRCSSNIDAAWAKVGITCVTNFVCVNHRLSASSSGFSRCPRPTASRGYKPFVRLVRR